MIKTINNAAETTSTGMPPVLGTGEPSPNGAAKPEIDRFNWSSSSGLDVDALSRLSAAASNRDAITDAEIPFGSAGRRFIERNIDEARSHRVPDSDRASNPFFAAGEDLGNMSWFSEQVRTGGVWDFKNHPKEMEAVFPKEKGESDASYREKLDRLGQMNYGATGAALGMDERLILKNAYTPKTNPHPEDPVHPGDPGKYVETPFGRYHYDPWDGSPPYWDKPQDQADIKRRFEIYHRYAGS